MPRRRNIKGLPSPRKTPVKRRLSTFVPSSARKGASVDASEDELAPDNLVHNTPSSTQKRPSGTLKFIFRTTESRAGSVSQSSSTPLSEESSSDEFNDFVLSADISRASSIAPIRRTPKRLMARNAIPQDAWSPTAGSPTKRQRRTASSTPHPPQTPSGIRNFDAGSGASTPRTMIFSPAVVNLVQRSVSPSPVIRRYRSLTPQAPQYLKDLESEDEEDTDARRSSQSNDDVDPLDEWIVLPLSDKQRGKLPDTSPQSPIFRREPDSEGPVSVPSSPPPSPPPATHIDSDRPEYSHRNSLSPPRSLCFNPFDEDSDHPQTPPPTPPRSQFIIPQKPSPKPISLSAIWTLPPLPNGDPSLPYHGPACPSCKKASTRRQVIHSNVPNGTRPYYKCLRCQKFITFADKAGIDAENPSCKCPGEKPSRKEVTTRSDRLGPGVTFFCCAEGVCDFRKY